MRKYMAVTGAMVMTGWLGMAGISGAQTPAPQPSPDKLEEAIDQRWENDATFKDCKGCDLDVEVTGTTAKISGAVPTAALRARAAQLALVTGVTRVDNEIKIAAPTDAADKTREGLNKAANKTADGVDKAADKTAEGVSKAAEKTAEGVDKAAHKTGSAIAKSGEVIDDTWITTKVKSKYVSEDAVKGSDIKVETVNNVVTLSGTVPTASAHAAALRIARETEGVKRVVDNLTVAPKTS